LRRENLSSLIEAKIFPSLITATVEFVPQYIERMFMLSAWL